MNRQDGQNARACIYLPLFLWDTKTCRSFRDWHLIGDIQMLTKNGKIPLSIADLIDRYWHWPPEDRRQLRAAIKQLVDLGYLHHTSRGWWALKVKRWVRNVLAKEATA